MDKEKFIQRVENMIYYTCGCSFDEAEIILKECLIKNEKRKKEMEQLKLLVQ